MAKTDKKARFSISTFVIKTLTIYIHAIFEQGMDPYADTSCFNDEIITEKKKSPG